jgi:hypothetical protein
MLQQVSTLFLFFQKMVQNYPYEWVDIPKEEVKAAMPNTTEEYVR